MVLGGGQFVGSAESQAGIQGKMTKAMQDLSVKAERQRQEREIQDSLDMEEDRKEKENQRDKNNLINSHDLHYTLDQSTFEMLKENRKAALKKQKQILEESKYGEIFQISQDQFLETVLETKFCVVHFYHKSFEKCDLMNKILAQLALQHKETKICKIDAEKSPFFVERLDVKVLPSLICFIDGKQIDNILGFDFDIKNKMSVKPDKIENIELQVKRLEERLGLCGIVKMPKEFYFKDLESTSEVPNSKNGGDNDDDDDKDGECSSDDGDW